MIDSECGNRDARLALSPMEISDVLSSTSSGTGSYCPWNDRQPACLHLLTTCAI